MEEDIQMSLEMAKDSMEEAIARLQRELSKIRAGKASPAVLSGVMVNYYGNPTPLNQCATVSTSDARTIAVQPWEKKMLPVIEKAIFEANLGFTPMNNGEVIRITIPPLTEDRRKEYVKRAKALGEDAKVSIRNARQESREDIKSAVKDGYPEDAGKRREGELQDTVNKYSEMSDKLVEAKEKDIMTI